jgi:RNA polymerase sigma-70 factor (ECF subfamily)
MADASASTALLQLHLERMQAGDPAAREALFAHVRARLERLAGKMLQGYPGVRRWEQTDDVLQGALVRLLRALEEVRPASVRGFLGLAAEQVRRELLDLARHHFGPEGPGAKHASAPDRSDGRGPLYDRADLSHEPSALAGWCEFHRQVEQLPEPEREVVGLLFYQELSQVEAADLLGVTVRTVQRRWQSALLMLHKVLKGQWPGL